ncbi:Rft-1-domain-containing protein [Peniophora sp. CONT]|nr:Rft-1-domain-containing protein [Peniophora sp. CONT]
MSDSPVSTSYESSLLSASLGSASSLVLLQAVSRIFTFALNQALVRLASPQTFGTAAIQFELLLSTILFLSREGVRNALLRSSSKQNDSKQVANISVLPVYFGIPSAFLMSFAYIWISAESTSVQPFFTTSVLIYATAASIELLSEPLYIRAQNELRFDIRVRAEGLAVFFKTIFTFLVLAFGPSEWALLAFAAGQMGYGLATFATFASVYGVSGHFGLKSVDKRSENNSAHRFDPELMRLSKSMTVQSVVKHFLTEGDKFLVSRLSPLEDQGGYAIASNYGSLVARIIFQPIEETSRVFFSKSLASVNGKRDQEVYRTASRLLMTLLLLFSHLLLLLAAFAPPYLPIATAIFLPPRYRQTSAPQILGAYIYYIPTMAFNGVLEAFFSSACTTEDLRGQSRMMMAASAGFVVASFALSQTLGMGDVGLIWANIANLGLRASYAWIFARRFFAVRGLGGAVSLSEALPPMQVMGVFAAAAAIVRASAIKHAHLATTLWVQKTHIAVGGTAGIACLLAWFVDVTIQMFKD